MNIQISKDIWLVTVPACTLREKRPNMELFLVQIQENTDQK